MLRVIQQGPAPAVKSDTYDWLVPGFGTSVWCHVTAMGLNVTGFTSRRHKMLLYRTTSGWSTDIHIRSQLPLVYTAYLCLVCYSFSALTLLVGRQEGHPACKKLSGGVQAWLSVWYRLTWVVPEKGPLNGCVCLLCLVCCFIAELGLVS